MPEQRKGLGRPLSRWIAGVLLLALSPLCYQSSIGAAPWPHQGKRLQTALEDGKPAERRRAVLALGSLTTSLARPGLTIALHDSDLEVRIVAAQTVIASGARGFAPLVREWMRSRNSLERLLATEILSRDPSAEDLRLLSKALTEHDKELRRAAAIALGRAPLHFHQRAREALVGALSDTVPELRIEVAAALGRVGDPSVVVALAASLQDPEWRVRAQVALALGVIGDRSVAPALLVTLSDEREEVVARAAEALGALRWKAAVPALVSLCQRLPLNAASFRSIEALATIASPAAEVELLNQLERKESRSFVFSAFETGELDPGPLLERCMKEGSGRMLHDCAGIRIAQARETQAVFGAYQEGRLGATQTLRLFEGQASTDVILLALEMLSDTDPKERAEALIYLSSLSDISVDAWQPLVMALHEESWTSSQVALLLLALSRSSGAVFQEGIEIAELYLQASSGEVRAAAASLVVALGAEGEALKALLLDPRSEVAIAAVQQLTLGMSQLQARTVVALIIRGQTGRRDLLLSCLWAVPEALPSSELLALESFWNSSKKGARDAVLNAFSRNGDEAFLERLLAKADRADQMKLAQLAWYHSNGGGLASRLVHQEDDRTVALALPALGLRGSRPDVPLVLELARGKAKTHRPHYVRAAAYEALLSLHGRQLIQGLPTDLFKDEACQSKHVPLRSAALRLAASAQVACGTTPLSDVLMLESNPLIRLVAAQIVRKLEPESAALRRCVAYETRTEVSAACAGRDAASRQARGGTLPRLSSAGLPFQMVTLSSSFDIQPLLLAPAVLLSAGRSRVLASDRRGQLLLPIGGYQFLDPYLSY